MKPIITVYITNYNYGSYIEEAITSVLAQTYDSFELIIIDDGSNDDSKRIINKYNNKKNVFAVFQKNKGLNTSNNVALNLARGKYIMRLDADDFIAPQAIELMVAELERNPEYAMVFPDYYLVDENGDILEQIKRHDFQNSVSLLDQPAHGACTVIRIDILKSLGGYDEEFNCQDGYDIWLKITELYAVGNISLPLFYYRQHQKSITKDETRLFDTRTKVVAKNVKNRKIHQLNILAIIPVRGKELDPRSNPLKKIGNQFLIDWTIDFALLSNLLLDVVISSSDHGLKEYVKKKYGDKIIWIERDKALAAINTSIEKTALDALSTYEKDNNKVDAVMMLYIEYPFRSTIYIDQAIHILQLYDVDSVSSVRKDNDMFFIHSGHGLEQWHKSKKLRLERDELYRRAGGLHLIRRDILVEKQDMLFGRMGHVAVDQKAAFQVKTDLDIQIANHIAMSDN